MKLVWNIKNVEFSSFFKNKILFFDSWPSCLECQKKIYSDKHKHSLFGHFLLGATELRNYSLWAADSMSYLVKLSDMYCQTKDGHFCLCTVIRIPDLESFAGNKAWESCKKKKKFWHVLADLLSSCHTHTLQWPSPACHPSCSNTNMVTG